MPQGLQQPAMLLEAGHSTDCGLGQEDSICRETPDPPPNIRRLWECSGQHRMPASEQIDGWGYRVELTPAPCSLLLTSPYSIALLFLPVNVASAWHIFDAAGSPLGQMRDNDISQM